MIETVPQPYPLFLAEITRDNKLRYGRIVYWRRDRPNVLFTRADGRAQKIQEVYLDDASARAWIGDSIAELRAHLQPLLADPENTK